MNYTITVEDEFGNKVRIQLQGVWNHYQFAKLGDYGLHLLAMMLADSQQFQTPAVWARSPEPRIPQ